MSGTLLPAASVVEVFDFSVVIMVVVAAVVVGVTLVVILVEVAITLSFRDLVQGLFLITTPPSEDGSESSLSFGASVASSSSGMVELMVSVVGVFVVVLLDP